ncbi:hypothetical protein AMAG_01196 [Allomyces macrogynus ATCC 38327]|uniref:Uncharacterized protein n=1 Tax=Allomyces macrogynus (strain ATCC 38327) TaxID=578462 RepID=A0A0L0RYY0_ALLM3|nr:hypothetical protein AMAG_01196 [Allomyces macrogynus ATCC 38327]|eukprot:KNE55286.1 hypothetical protein AMAG_01196 [Allomyces macrogynus ATCC 38327]
MMADAAREDDEVEVESVGSAEDPSDDGSGMDADAMDVDDDLDMAPAPVPAMDVIDFTGSSGDEAYDEADELESASHQLGAFDAATHQLDGDDELLSSDEDSGAESDDDDGDHAWHDHHVTPRQRGWGSDAVATPRPFPRASTAAHVPPPHRSLFSGAPMSWSDKDSVDGEDVGDDAASDGSGPIVLDDSNDEEQVDELVPPSTACPAADVPIKREPVACTEEVPIKHELPTWDEDVAMDEDDDDYASSDEEDWAEEDAQDPWTGHAASTQPAWAHPFRPAATEVVTVDSTDDEADDHDDDRPIELISSSPAPPASPVRHCAPSPAAPVPPTPTATLAAPPAVPSTPVPAARTPSSALLGTPVHEPPTKKVKLFTVPHVDALVTPRPAVASPATAARHAFGTMFTPPAADRAIAATNDDEPVAPEEEDAADAPAETAAGGGFLAGFLKGILSAWRPPSFF